LTAAVLALEVDRIRLAKKLAIAEEI